MKKCKQNRTERLIIVCYKLICHNEELLVENNKLKAQLKAKSSCSCASNSQKKRDNK